jgi:hypothetical protein
MKVDFAAARKQAESKGVLGSGDYFKLQEGDDKIRLMSECLEHPGEYQGKPTFKWLCYVLDRRDGRIKPFFMAHTIYKQIEALQQDSDYAFDEVPMPYDITIKAKNAGKKEVEYAVIADRQNNPVTPAERALLVGKGSIADLQAALNVEREGTDVSHPNPGAGYDDLPPIPADEGMPI